jgi:Pvc16 N-terminal domain
VSNALAIASVTAVLKDILNNGVIDNQLSGDATVSALPPDRVLVNGQPETNRLNLFLYQVTPNLGWRNVGLPSHDSRGERVANPPLGLDLHYLLTAYGASEFQAEILLGYGMQMLHEAPVLTRDAIRRALTPTPPFSSTVLPPALQGASDLADQVESIRITPQVLSSEEISKLWTAIQSHYRPTAAYQASVVLIESRRSRRVALPVANDERRIYVVPFRHAAIELVTSAAGSLAPIQAGTTLEIRGRDLAGDITAVLFDGIDVTPPVSAITPELITVALPGSLPAGLYAGVKTAQVIHQIRMGDPETPHRGFESNVGAFVLRPIVKNGPIIAPGDIENLVSSTEIVNGTSVALRAGTLKIVLEPRVTRAQRVSLLLNELSPPAGQPAHAYAFLSPAGNGVVDPDPDTATVRIPFARVVAGTYLVRVQVDGAESVLDLDAGGFATPRVALT